MMTELKLHNVLELVAVSHILTQDIYIFAFAV